MKNSRSTDEARIRACEEAYIRCFSIPRKEGNMISYENPALPDMYDHNFFKISTELERETRSHLIEKLYKEACQSGKKFLHIAADVPLSGERAEKEHLGAYILRSTDDLNWEVRTDCHFIKVKDKEGIKALTEFDIAEEGGIYGEDFCRRRAVCRGKVYQSEAACDCYLCYIGEELVGKCDLFIDQGTAKIEDFVVKEAFRRKQIGTTILAYLIQEAASKGASTLYLCADEEDTPKEMYLKLGFEKVTDFYGLLWHFN